MSHTRFLKIVLPIAAIPALIVLFLPAGVVSVYIDVIEPISLTTAAALALWVAFIYRKGLKAAFVFLSVFLFIYMLAIVLFLSNSPILLPGVRNLVGDDHILLVVQGVQFVNYFVLILFCVNLLKVVDIRRLDGNGWLISVLAFFLCMFLAIFPELELIKNLSSYGLSAVLYIIIRILDAALIVVLTPVVWLYIQHLKSRQKQSLTFTVVIFGIVCATLFDYLFQLVVTVFPRLLAEGSPLYKTIPEALFIYGYLIIIAGLYAHRKQDEWGYNAVDKAINGGLELADIK